MNYREKHMTTFQQIIDKFNEFNSYLEGIDLDKMKQEHTRLELKKFSRDLYNLKVRSLAYEVRKIVDEMKIKEFPQLLGVHHFPIINNVDFLTENEKIELDKFLVKHRVGDYVGGLWHITRNESKRKQLEEWLFQNGVIEEVYAVLCSHCHNGHISKILTHEEKSQLEINFKRYKETADYNDYEKIERVIEYICMECDHETEIDYISELHYKELYKMKLERDTSLDNV